MKTQSIKFKATLFLSLFAVAILVSVGFTFYFIDSQSSDARVINIAGRQRMLSQKYAKEVIDELTVSQSSGSNGSVESRSSNKTRDLFDLSLNALKDGGTTYIDLGMTESITIPMATNPDVHAQLGEIAVKWSELQDAVVKIQGLKVHSPAFESLLDDIRTLNIALLKQSNNVTNLLVKDSGGKTSTLKFVQVAALLIVLLLASLALYLLRRVLFKPIDSVVAIIKNMSEGNLTTRIDVTSKDEIGDLARYFNSTVDKLEDMIGNISGSTESLAVSSSQLYDTSGKISSGSESQSEKTTQVASASEEMSATIVEVSKNAAIAAKAAGEANKAANDGANIVSMTIESMNGIAMSARESSEVISTLGNSSQEIDKIIKVIEDIADQTNLLALNAAIEAARAGEQGRGFAVVADEVRKLAERTTKATKEIGTMITSIQTETEKALTSMENEVKVVEEGVARAQHAGESLTKIASEVENVTTMIEQIASATEEQSTAADMISGDIETVAAITREMVTGSQEINGASDEIAQRANALKEMVAVFKVREHADVIPIHGDVSVAPPEDVITQEAV